MVSLAGPKHSGYAPLLAHDNALELVTDLVLAKVSQLNPIYLAARTNMSSRRSARARPQRGV